MLSVPVVPGHADGGQNAATSLPVVEYPYVMAFLSMMQGRTLPQSGARLWVIWAGILRAADQLRGI